MEYLPIVPADSFLGRYLAYMHNQETATSFDWWTGLWCISAACARAVYVARPRAPVYLNMFLILVGESGLARKTTSVQNATRIVRSMLAHYPEILLMDAKITPEKLEEELQDHTHEYGSAQCCMSSSELAVMLGTEHYIKHMPTLLTELYDCPAARDSGGTIARGAISLRNVWLTLLAASTPIWLLKTVNPNVVEGGFTSRCYFIVANDPKHAIPWPTESDPALYDDLCSDLRIIAQEARKQGPILLTDDAKEHFIHWYNGRERSINTFKQSFESREDAHVLRVAALMAINDGSWFIDTAHIEYAILLLHDVKTRGDSIFDEAEAQSKFSIGLDKMRSVLISSGMDAMLHGQLFRQCRMHLSTVEFAALLEVLHEIGAIQRFSMKSEGGKRSEYVRGTQLLMSRELGTTVLEKFTR